MVRRRVANFEWYVQANFLWLVVKCQILFLNLGKKWAHRRKMLTHAFHFKILEQFFDIFNEHSKDLVNVLKTNFSNGEKFEISKLITKCTLEIICGI